MIDAIAYEQDITQVESADCPASNLKGANKEGIHHEPGFFLQFLNHVSIGHTEEEGEPNGADKELKIARLATIPHGNSVLAMGTAESHQGAPVIEKEDARPERISQDLMTPYLAPLQTFSGQTFLWRCAENRKWIPWVLPDGCQCDLAIRQSGHSGQKNDASSI